jgi:hypothetical protein
MHSFVKRSSKFPRSKWKLEYLKSVPKYEVVQHDTELDWKADILFVFLPFEVSDRQA